MIFRHLLRRRGNGGAGLERAKAQGTKLGRPKVSAKKEQAIRDARAEGKGVLMIAREVDVGTGTVQRVLK